MTIISKTKLNGNQHAIESQSHRTSCWIDDYIEVPEELEAEVWNTLGWCDLVLKDGKLVGILPTERPSVDLKQAKAQRIAQSKADLAAYLDAHPLQWTDGEYYAITAEKQAQLTSKIMSATMAQTLSQPYDLTWNSTGEVCKAWTLQDLSALAFAIDARVTALVTYQQTQEVAMRNAADLDALAAVVVDYDTVQ